MKALSSPKVKSLLPLLCGYAGYILWGFSYHFITVAQKTAPSSVLLSHRFIVACVIMLVLVATKLVKVNFRNKKWWSAILLVAFQVLYFLFETATSKHTNDSFASAASAVSPVISILLAMAFLQEFPTKRQSIFCLLPIIGVIMVTLAGKSLGVVTTIGVVFLVLSTFTSGAYRTINRMASKYFSPFERTLLIFICSSLSFTVTAMRDVHWDLQAYVTPLTVPSYLWSMLFLSTVCSLICHLLVNYATANLPVVKISSLGAVTTLVAMIVGLVKGNPWNITFLIGSVLIIVGIWQVTKVPKVKEEKTELKIEN